MAQHEKERKAVTKDPRFATLHNDPRFALPRRKDRKVTVDERFKGMLEDEDFRRAATVDRYGRKLDSDVARSEIKRLYDLEEEDESGSNDEETEFQRRYDAARGDVSASSSDDEGLFEEEGATLDETAASDDVPQGEPTSRFALVNLDWDHVKAVDIFATLYSFASPGNLESVRIYSSEFGKQKLAREEKEGPPPELFQITKNKDIAALNIEANGELKDDEGEDYDHSKLRQYQLERLRYYYAIGECDSVRTAKKIAQECDGAEFEASGNFFDIRFVPEETTFDDAPKDECRALPGNYKPNEFVTDALQHSKVKLTWDEDNPERTQYIRKAFSRRDFDDMDMKAYLASSDENEDEEAAEQLRNKYRQLLGNSDHVRGGNDVKNTSVDADQVAVFSPGVAETATTEERPRDMKEQETETTIERYRRKERERKERRKKKVEQSNSAAAEAEDTGFEDPFFSEKPATSRRRKEKENRKVWEGDEDDAKKRAELELLLREEDDGNMTKLNHFDMKDVVKSEKRKRKREDRTGKASGAEEWEGAQDDFKVNVSDPRFASVYSDYDYAIDPSNPRFKKTRTMQQLLEEKRRRRDASIAEDILRKKQKSAIAPRESNLQDLVASIKGKSKSIK